MQKPIIELTLKQDIANPFSEARRGIVPNFSRLSGGYSEDEQGNVVIVGNNAFRWKKLGTKFYLALEAANTNILGNSSSEDISKWTQDGTVATFAKTQTGPTGEYDADEVVFSATQGNGVRESVAGLGNRASSTLTFSIWAKAASGTPSIRMRLVSNNAYETVKALTTTWTRYTFTQTMVGGDTNNCVPGITPNDTSAPTVYFWGAQVEVAAVPSSYFPTTARTVTNRNLVNDGDMEMTGVASWTALGGAVITKDSTTVKFGNQSIKVVSSVQDNGISQTIATVIGQTYKFSAWVFSNTFSHLSYLNWNGVASGSSQQVTATGVWTYLEINFKATGTSQTITLRNGINSANTVYWDKVQLIKQNAPEPSLESTFAQTYLTFPRGTQISGNNYQNLNINQGSISFWFKPNWAGNDNMRHEFFMNYVDGNNELEIFKNIDNKLYFSMIGVGAGNSISADVSGWTAGTYHLITVRWDCDNPVVSTSRMELLIDGSTAANGTTVLSPYAPSATSYIGIHVNLSFSADGTFDDFAIFDRVLSTAEITTLYNSGSAARAGLLADTSLKVYFPFDDSGSFTAGTASGVGCSSGLNQLNGGSGVNKIVNGGFEAALGAEWAVTSATQVQYANGSVAAGFNFDINCLQVTNSGAASGSSKQTVSSLAAGNEFYFSAWLAKGTGNARITVYSGSGGALTTVVADFAAVSSIVPVRIEACFAVAAGHNSITVLCIVDDATSGHTAFFDNIVMVPNKVTNGAMAGAYAAGVAPGWTKTGAPTVASSASSQDGDSLAQSVANTAGAANNIGQTFTVITATWHAISAWAKRTAGTGNVFLDSVNSGNLNPPTGVFTTSATYARLAAVGRSSSATGGVLLYNTNTDTTGVFDDVAVVPLASIDITVTVAAGAQNPDFVGGGSAKLGNAIHLAAQELPSPWNTVAASTTGITLETVVTHSGVQAIRCTCSAAYDGLVIINTNLALSNTTWYKLSCWIYIVSQSGAAIVPCINNDISNTNYNITIQKAKATIGAWQKVETIFKTGTLIGTNGINFVQNGAGNCVFILDDVSILQLDAPAISRLVETMSIPLTNPQPQNLLTYSEQIDNAAWTKDGGVTVTADNDYAPDGTLSADLVSITGVVSVRQTLSSAIGGASYTGSIWLRSKNGPMVVSPYIFDGFTYQGSNVQLTSKWRRFRITAGINVAATSIAFVIYNDAQVGGSPSFLMWGAQLEQALDTSQYVKTTSAAQGKVFANYASSNFCKESGSLNFWAILSSNVVNNANIFGSSADSSLLICTDGGGNIQIQITGRNKAGALTIKSQTITTAASVSTTAEHMFSVTWSTERDGTGKQIQSRLKVYLDGNKLVDQVYSDIERWAYNSTVFKIIDQSQLGSYVRDIRIYRRPFVDQDVTDLYVAG